MMPSYLYIFYFFYFNEGVLQHVLSHPFCVSVFGQADVTRATVCLRGVSKCAI